jgi:hypothetical protein
LAAHCSWSLAAAAATNLRDLYVLEAYVDFSTTPRSRCNVCEETTSDNGCFLSQRSLLIQDACANDFGGGEAWSGNASSICRRPFVTNTCTEAWDGECFAEFPVDACVNGRYTSRYPDFCIASAVPQTDYVVPMIHTRIYRELSTCQNETSLAYQEILLVDDATLCQSAVIAMGNDTTTPSSYRTGSARLSCNADDTHVVDLFVDDACQTKSPSQTLHSIQRDSTCRLESTGDTTRYTTAACQAPQFHCKDMRTTHFSLTATTTTTEQPSKSPVGSPPVSATAGPTAETPSASDVGSQVALVRLALMSLIGYMLL